MVHGGSEGGMQHSGGSARHAPDTFADRHRGWPVPRLPRTAPSRALRALLALVVAFPLAAASLAVLPEPAHAGDGLKMTAQTMLHGRARAGSWYAIAVDVENAGPTITGELRVVGGTDGHTRFVQAAELATGSRKRFVLYAQPVPFSADAATVELVADGKVVASAKADVLLGDVSTTTIGILADNAAKLVGEIGVLSGKGLASATVPLTVTDLPDRVQAWAPIDSLVWQDVDASSLNTQQLAALRAWVAAGGRLVIIGGTAGPAALTALPDDMLPYRPTATLDIDPSVLRAVLGGVPSGATTLPALAGTLAHGRALAKSGDRVVAADLAYGSGTVTLLGFDPTTSWIAQGDTWDAPLWRKLLGGSSQAAATAIADDSMVVSGAINLPSIALPGTEGLLALLIAYIVLIGPVNYIVLRVLDKRELAWVTVPVLIAVFTVAAFGIGVVGRGSEIVVHQVAIVRGAQGTDLATAQAWSAIFSPSRDAFQISTGGDALLSGSISGDSRTGQATGAIDVLEGDPTRLRDFTIGYGSVRTIRADGTTKGPLVEADLHLEGKTVKGTVTNRSSMALSSAAMVMGSSLVEIGDVAAGATAQVNLEITSDLNNWNGSPMLSDRLLGDVWNLGRSESEQHRYARHMILDQLTNNPNGPVFVNNGMGGGPVAIAVPAPMGKMQGSSLSSSVTLLAWGTEAVIPVDIAGAQPKRISDVLYTIPMRVAVTGQVHFDGDLLTGTITSNTSMNFWTDPSQMSMDTGAMTMSYRPMAFQGTLAPSSVQIAMRSPGMIGMPGGTPAAVPIGGRCATPTAKDCSTVSTFPDVDVFDVQAGAWVELGGLSVDVPYTLTNAARWVDPATGEVQVRFTNQSHDQISWLFAIAVDGVVQ